MVEVVTFMGAPSTFFSCYPDQKSHFMYSSKLITVIRSLDRREFRRLEKFIRHPYFLEIKQKQKALQLFEVIKNCYPDLRQETLKKSEIFQLLFPGEPFAVDKLDKVMTRLLKAVRSFIAYEYADPSQKKVRQLLTESEFYRKKSLDAYFLQSMEQLRQHQKRIRLREMDFYYTQFLLDRNISEYDSLYNKRKEDLNLLNTHRSLDVFYLVAKLEYACWILAQNTSHVPLEIRESLKTLDLLAPLIAEDYGREVPIIELFFQVYLLLRDGDQEETGDRLRILLEKYAELLPFDQLTNLQAIYRSYCVREYNRGNLSLEYLFDLYKEHLEKGYLYRQGGLQPGIIKNLVNFGLKLKAHDWVWQFLEQYKDKIVGTKHPSEVYYFNLANYYFSRKAYEKVLDTLQWHEEDTYYKIAAKRLELKVFYEQRSTILESKMDAFKVYIFRVSKKLLPPLHREGNNNFINLLRQVYNPGTRKNAGKIENILAKIHSDKHTVEREWLLEKLEELR